MVQLEDAKFNFGWSFNTYWKEQHRCTLTHSEYNHTDSGLHGPLSSTTQHSPIPEGDGIGILYRLIEHGKTIGRN